MKLFTGANNSRKMFELIKNIEFHYDFTETNNKEEMSKTSKRLPSSKGILIF